jgi:hypothetical protein
MINQIILLKQQFIMKKNYLQFISIGLFFFLGIGLSFGQTIIYDADYSNDGDGFTDHTSATPPAAAPASVGPFGAIDNQWFLSYNTAPGTDVTANSFSISGGALVSSDWGGQGIFQSQSIDLTGISTLNISALTTNINANDNQFVYFYILDGGSRVETANISSNDGESVNYSISNLDVSGNSSIVVGFEFSENGDGSGYSTTSFTVIDISGPGIALGNVSGPTTEAGGTATFTVILNEQPTNDVVLDISSTDTGEVTVSPSTLTFTNANWNQTQLVTATGQDDPLVDSDIDVTINVVVNDASSDDAYDGLSASTLITNEDNELPILVINEILADPANDVSGDANGDGTRDAGDDEFVELYNTTGAALDISGFILKEGSIHKHVFPSGTILPPNGSIVVFGGGTVSSFTNVGGIVQVASAGNLSLNNTGDTVTITDESDNIIDTYTYTSEANSDQSIAREPDFSGNFVQHNNITGNSVSFSPGKDNTDNSPFIKTWIGTTDNSWTTSTNWLEGDVPTNTDNAIIPNRTSVTNFPIANGTIQLNDLMVEANASLELTPTSTTPSAILEMSGNLINNGNLIFRSNGHGTAQLDEFTGTLSGTGDFTVERYMSDVRAFRLLSSPVTTTDFISNNWQQNTHITGASGTIGQTSAEGFDETPTGNPSMYTFDNSYVDPNPDPVNGPDQTPGYISISNTNATNLEVGTPYVLFVRGDRNIDLTSNTASSETTLSATGSMVTGRYPAVGSVPLSQEESYWSLVANPYQASVNYDVLTKSGLRADMSVYNPTTGAYEALDANRIILPGQSVWVQNLEDLTSTTVSLHFEEANKLVTGNNNTTVFSQIMELSANLELYNHEGIRKDVLKFRFNSNYDSNLDDNDFGKLLNTDENLATNFNMLLSIDRRKIPQDSDVVPLFTSQYLNTQYEFRLNLDNWDPNVEIFVQDDYLNTTTQITPNQAYAFSVDASIPESIAEDRFSLVFNNTTLNVNENNFDSDFRVYPNPSQNGMFSILTSGLNAHAQIELSNILGKVVNRQFVEVSGNQIDVNAQGLTSGIYILKVSQGNKTYTTKVIIE